MTETSRIQLSRSKYIEESRAIAVLRLNEYDFYPGEIVMMSYYKNPDFRNDIGVLVAIGVKKGIGENCYRLISAGGTVRVRDVIDKLPDVSKLVHGELYIYKSPEEKWFYVYKKNGEEPGGRVIEEITGGPFIFVNLEDGYRWFYENQDCKREDDFFTTGKIEEILQLLADTSYSVNVSSESGYIFKTGDVKDVTLKIKVTDNHNNDVTSKCTILIDGGLVELDENYCTTIKNQNHDRKFTVEARTAILGNVTASFFGTAEIRFGYIFYYGEVDDAWVPTSDAIKELPRRVLNYRQEFKWSKIELENQKMVFAYPVKYGFLSHIFDESGLELIHTYQIYKDHIFVDGLEYIAYVKKDATITARDVSQRYVFDDTTTLAVEEQNILQLVDAWKNKNTAEGLVCLNVDGKIPEELYNLDPSSTFTKIKAFVPEIPTSGMEKGDVYYIEGQNLFYIAISETEGYYETPETGMIYVYGIDLYSSNGTKLTKYSKLGSRKINDITELFD